MPKSHKCFATINKQLAEHNTALAVHQGINFKTGKLTSLRLEIATEKLDSRKRKPKKMVIASYCPFCGEKLK